MAGKTMRAVRYAKYGGGASALKHVEVPVPSPGKDEVLLKVEAATINPFDWKIQKGVMRPFLPSKFPYTPGDQLFPLDNNGCGRRSHGVGPGVEEFKAGDKVIAFLSPSTGGGFAEYTIASKNVMALRAPGLSAAEGAGLPIAAVTAYRCLTKVAGLKVDGSGEKKNALITAASGGVGHYAVQIAKLANTHVTATCGARNLNLVRSLGADEVLDYKTPEGAALESPSGKKYDVVVHCTSGIPWSTFKRNLSGNSLVIDLTPGPSTMMRFVWKKVTFAKKMQMPVIVFPTKGLMESVMELVAAGKVKTLVDSRHTLSRVEDAWGKAIGGHATGKIIVEP